jgi:ATP-dependent helicase/nuclease subunit B
LGQKLWVRARFLIGPAGTGKTFLCLAEIREALRGDPSGPPLILLAPRQATFQLERQLLADPGLEGYTRLQILSFPRLASFVLEQSGAPMPPLLSEDGRSMVLHALLARRRNELEIFHASAGRPGLARQLGVELREVQRRRLSPDSLRALAEFPETGETLRRKLRDLALLLTDYSAWLLEHGMQDADCLLDLAAEALKRSPPSNMTGALWLDGFAEMTAQELELLAAVAPRCQELTLAFCLEKTPSTPSSWLSIWSGIEKTFRQCWDRLSAIPEASLATTILARREQGRFINAPALRHLESNWTQPSDFGGVAPEESLRAVICATPASEAVLAAQEILRFVRSGGRFREVAVILRAMESHQDSLRRVFSRYEIPFFMDRREKVGQHPLAELARSVLRAAALGWRHDDWFGALKTGLVAPEEEDIDRLENEALARGWSGEAWFAPLPPDNLRSDWPERLRQRWIAPFEKFRRLNRPNGPQLAGTMRQLWRDLNVEKTLEGWSAADAQGGGIHATVWRQLNAWLDDLTLAFAEEPMPLADWLPILEAGLADLSVGVIPPALDQVLIGSIDRSRNPDLKLAILLGVNETVFPAPPPEGSLFNETDLEELGRHDVRLGHSRREFLGRERFLGYIACTRSRQRLVVSCSERDSDDQPLNPSPFFSHLKSLFANLKIEKFSGADWTRAEHVCELSGQLARASGHGPLLRGLLDRSAFAALREQINSAPMAAAVRLAPELAARLYGPALRTSVSRLEEFASCAFKFFIHSGLRAEERQRFELDVRERGSFQHEALARFHQQLRDENKNWRDITPAEARERVKECVDELLPQFREGLLAASAQSRFTARVVAESLQDFVAATVEWMAHYQFDPQQSELGFGTGDEKLPAWELDLGSGRRLLFRGKIDRVDVCGKAGADQGLAVVIDYKSGALKLENILMANGLQLQLLAYLAVLRHLASARELFGAGRLVPAGVFYVNLGGKPEKAPSRTVALQTREQSRQKRYQHLGRFDGAILRYLDSSGGNEGAQFKYRLKLNGAPHGGNTDLLRTKDFQKLLDHVEAELLRMGRDIYDGVIEINPYQRGNKAACDKCDYKSICRFDPWTQPYRVLRASREEPAGAEN